MKPYGKQKTNGAAVKKAGRKFSNFFLASNAVFHEDSVPNREPDFVSGAGGPNESRYWYEGEYLYRQSNHWFDVLFCRWLIFAEGVEFRKHQNPKFKALNPYRNGKEIRLCGRVKFSEMKWRRGKIQEAKAFFNIM